MIRTIRRTCLFAFVLALVAGSLSAQSQRTVPIAVDDGEFHFARLVYKSGGYGYRGRGRSSFDTDFPEAEHHLRQGLERLTRLHVGDYEFIELDDDDIMNYPWLYAVEVGRWYLDDKDAALVREYLLRGGFLMVDDFHGTEQWNVFVDSMQRVFPDRPIVEIGESDEIMRVLYDLHQDIQIPGIQFLSSGSTCEQCNYGGREPHWRGIYDDEGRLMVAINFNMDLGDAWEHADDPRYPEPMTGLAYRWAVNYVIYSMTH